MAKVLYTAIVADLKGRLSGSVFQTSVGGNVLRSLVVPINRRTTKQQRVRSSLAAVTSSWRYCSEANRNSWAGSTQRQKFESYTAFNWVYMWLLSSKSCVEFAPAPANMPNNATYAISHVSPTEPVFGLYGADDAVYAAAGNWFVRMSKPRVDQSGTPGEMIMYRGALAVDVQENQWFVNIYDALVGFTWSVPVGYWFNLEFVIMSGAYYGTTGVMELQAT